MLVLLRLDYEELGITEMVMALPDREPDEALAYFERRGALVRQIA